MKNHITTSWERHLIYNLLVEYIQKLAFQNAMNKLGITLWSVNKD